MSDPREWHIASDREGFFIEDEFGEEVNPLRRPATAGWRCQSYEIAQAVLHDTIRDALENDEPPDPPGFEGGFAPNH